MFFFTFFLGGFFFPVFFISTRLSQSYVHYYIVCKLTQSNWIFLILISPLNIEFFKL